MITFGSAASRRSWTARAAAACAVAALGLAVFSAGDASGAPKPTPSKPAAPAAGALDLERLRADLESGQPARIRSALQAIDAAPAEERASAAPLVGGLLERGASVDLLVLALPVAGRVSDPALGGPVAPYVAHRDASVRKHAVTALTSIKGSDAVRALRRALRSKDPATRGLAASGLGALGAREALPDLFAALDQRVAEAAGAIGQLCDAASCPKLLERLGKIPLEVVLSGFDQLLFRDAAEVPETLKLEVVERLAGLGSRDALTYLAEVRARWPKDGSPKVKQALDAAVRGTRGKEGT